MKLSDIADRKPLDWTVPTVALGRHQIATVFYRNHSGTMSPYTLEEAVKKGMVRVKELGGSWQNAVALIEIRMSRVCLVLQDEAAPVDEPAITKQQYEAMKRKQQAEIDQEYGLRPQTHKINRN